MSIFSISRVLLNKYLSFTAVISSLLTVLFHNRGYLQFENPYAASQVTYALQEGFYSRRFLMGSLFHPIAQHYRYDINVLHFLSYLGFYILILTLLFAIRYMSSFDRYLLAGALLLLPGSVIFLNIGFMEGWGYFFIAIASWLAYRGPLSYLLVSFFFLALAYAASDHSILFGGVIYLYFAVSRWGYLKVLPGFTLVTSFFTYLLVFTSTSVETAERLRSKIASLGTELPIEGFRYLTSNLYNIIPINGRGEVFTDPGVSRVGQTALWAVVFTLVLSIIFLIKRSGFVDYIYGLLFTWAPFPLSIVAYDWGRWQAMIFLNFSLAYVINQRGLTGRGVIGARILFFVAIIFLTIYASNLSFYRTELFRVVGLVR